MRVFLAVFLSVLVLVLAAALIGPGFVDWNRYKPQILDVVEEQTGYEMRIDGDLSLAVLPLPHLTMRDAGVKAPVQGRADELAAVKSLELYVEPMPLLQGRVVVRSLTLVEPQIVLETSAQGRPNWMTPEIEALTAGDAEQASAAEPAQAELDNAGGSSFDVAFQSVRIENGRFAYYDGAKRSQQILEDVTLDISADSLSGPYAAEGSLRYNGMDVALEASAPYVELEQKSLPLRLSARVLGGKAALSYSGTVDFGDQPAAQGEFSAAFEGLRDLAGNTDIPDAAQLEGFLSADAKSAVVKDAELAFGGNTLTGSLSADLAENIVLKVDLSAQNGLDLQPILSKFDQFAIAMSARSGSDGALAFDVSRLQLGQQRLALDGVYKPAAQEGARPALALTLAADTLDADALLGQAGAKGGETGSQAGQGAASSSAKGAKASKADLADSLRQAAQGLALPFDLSAQAEIGTLRYGGAQYKGVALDAVLRGPVLTLNALRVADMGGASVSVSGVVDNVPDLAGMDLKLALTSSDLPAFMANIGQDASALPKGLKRLEAQAAVQGSVDALDFTANADALGGSVLAKGQAAEPLGQVALSGLVVQVKHPNTSRLLQEITGSAYPQLSGPLDFYTKLDNDGTLYRFAEMKADLAGVPVQGDLSIDMGGARPKLAGDLRLGDLSLVTAKGSRAASSSGSSSGGGAVRSGAEKWSSEAIDSGFLYAADLDLKLAAKALRSDNWALTQPSVALKLQDGALDVQDFSARLYGGTVNLDAALSAEQGGGKPLAMELEAQLRDVDIEQVMTSLAAGSKLIRGKGKVSLDTTLKSIGVSQMALVKALSGQGRVSGRDIVLEGFDLSRFVEAMDVNSKPGDTLLGIWKSSTRGGSTAFDTLEGSYVVQNGIIDIKSMDLDGAQAFVGTTGQVNLPQWRIKTDHTVTAKNREDVPPFEMSFEGSLDNPQQTFAQGPLEDYLSRKLNRKLEKLINDKLGEKLQGSNLGGALGNMLGGGGRGSQQQQQQQQPANDNQAAPSQQEQGQQQIKPEEAIQGILKGLIGR